MKKKNRSFRLRSLFVKPVSECTAECDHCTLRREFHSREDDSRSLRLADYQALFPEAARLGVHSLHISGGEPTLFPELAELVRLGKAQGWFVILNTNGSRPDRGRIQELLRAGLDAVIVSLQGATPETHDSIRRREGHWKKAVEFIEICRGFKSEFPHFFLTTQTIITRHNFRELPGIIDRVADCGVDAHGFSYLEADFNCASLPGPGEIRELREKISPALRERLRAHRFPHPLLRWGALRSLGKIYPGNGETVSDYSRGLFRNTPGLAPCPAPEVFALITARGWVLPCNMVEYVHAPIMGNILTRSFTEIWHSPEWDEFRRLRFDWCRFCPVHLHFHIPLNAGLHELLRLAWKNPAPEQKSISQRIKNAFW